MSLLITGYSLPNATIITCIPGLQRDVTSYESEVVLKLEQQRLLIIKTLPRNHKQVVTKAQPIQWHHHKSWNKLNFHPRWFVCVTTVITSLIILFKNWNKNGSSRNVKLKTQLLRKSLHSKLVAFTTLALGSSWRNVQVSLLTNLNWTINSWNGIDKYKETERERVNVKNRLLHHNAS